jgi:hypothetical protein
MTAAAGCSLQPWHFHSKQSESARGQTEFGRDQALDHGVSEIGWTPSCFSIADLISISILLGDGALRHER